MSDSPILGPWGLIYRGLGLAQWQDRDAPSSPWEAGAAATAEMMGKNLTQLLSEQRMYVILVLWKLLDVMFFLKTNWIIGLMNDFIYCFLCKSSALLKFNVEWMCSPVLVFLHIWKWTFQIGPGRLKHHLVTIYPHPPPPKTSINKNQNPPFEDVFPIEHGEFV